MSTKHGFAFLCMPKCASTSILTALKEHTNIALRGTPALKHIDFRTYTKTVLPLHKLLHPTTEIKTICMIRDPLEWINSWYRYRGREELKNHRNSTAEITYQEFIEEYISDGKRKPFADLRTQYNFLRQKDGGIGPDYVIPMHRLDILSRLLSERIGEDIIFGNKNVSPTMDFSLNNNVESRLKEFLANDIAVYNYIERLGFFDKEKHSQCNFAIHHDD